MFSRRIRTWWGFRFCYYWTPLYTLIAIMGLLEVMFVPTAHTAESVYTIEDIKALVPECSDNTEICLGIELFIVVTDEGTVQTPEWVLKQIQVANRHFAGVNVGFELNGVYPLDKKYQEIKSRSQRDKLGKDNFSLGPIYLYVVKTLVNVDEPGVIRGVHWRYRKDRSKHWIIMASYASDMVLAHELGHFFGLPHSAYAASIMNKTPRKSPPFKDWTFVSEELEILAQEITRMLSDGDLSEISSE